MRIISSTKKIFFILIISFLLFFLGCDNNTSENSQVKEEKTPVIEKVNSFIEEGELLKGLEIIPENTEKMPLIEKKLFIYYKTGKFEKALEIAEKIWQENQNLAGARKLSKIYYIQGNFKEFLKYFHLIPEEQRDSEILNMFENYNRILSAEKEEKNIELKEKFEDLISKYKRMHYNDCLSYARSILLDNQVIYEEENSKILKEIYVYSGLCSRKLNNFDDSIYYFKKALEVFPESSKALLNLGEIYFERGRTQLALDYFKSAWQASGDISIYGNVGLAYLNLGEYEKAKEVLEKVHNEKKNSITALYNLFLCYYNLDYLNELKETGEKLLQRAPKSSDIADSVRNVFNEKFPGEFR
ncbi:MAG: tetratricopeptide repeat protein [Candidatus Muiribacteriota bacterium]